MVITYTESAGIQTVYHQLFDEALKRYNEKQARADRRISNYYEKIRSGNQEKPFHEIVLQIGNKEDMSATGEYSELARQVLDEYYQGFQERNPNLRVFSAHLHMDEATPHIHIDFVPFTTGSKRGLDTRVSLKQAFAAQGFKGGTRGATEWAQWVQSEKEQFTHLHDHAVQADEFLFSVACIGFFPKFMLRGSNFPIAAVGYNKNLFRVQFFQVYVPPFNRFLFGQKRLIRRASTAYRKI